jgi:SAM-dependent methyltransferase
MCATLAPLFRLSRLKAYLAAHVNNAFTAPLLLYLELGTGHWLFERTWPALELEALRASGAWSLGRDLLVGSVLVGAGLGTVLGLAAFGIAGRRPPSQRDDRLREETARLYLGSGIFAWELVRGKLRHDPVYFGLLESGLLPEEGRILDLGCGRGILLALLHTARTLVAADGKAAAASAGGPELVGFDVRPRMVAQAREALGPSARFEVADLESRSVELPRSRAIILLDVLHYLSEETQESLLERAAAALEPGGLLVIREADAALGARHLLTLAAERSCALGRGHWRQRFHYRTAAAWEQALAVRGLEVSAAPMRKGTPYSNALLAGRRASAPRDPA